MGSWVPMNMGLEGISIKRKDYVPLIMWSGLFAAIIVLANVRSIQLPEIWTEFPIDVDLVIIGLYLLWMLIEFRISKRDVNTQAKRTSDFGTCQLYGAGQGGTIITALWCPSVWTGPSPAHFLGVGVFLCGCCYRFWAIRTLGRFYSHKVRTVACHQIVASGPYRLTRHPAYAGMIVANAGICLYFFNWITIGVFFLILVPAIILRIVVEERVLFGIAGYAEFAKGRKRLFPALW